MTAWAAIWAEYEAANRRARHAYRDRFCVCGGVYAQELRLAARCTECGAKP